MKSIIKPLVLIMAISMVLVMVLSACTTVSPEEAEKNLIDAGYEVKVLTGAEYDDSDYCEFPMLTQLEKYIYATKGNEVVHLYFFYTVDAASDNSSFMNAPSGLKSGQINNLVYFGTKQGLSDGKIK